MSSLHSTWTMSSAIAWDSLLKTMELCKQVFYHIHTDGALSPRLNTMADDTKAKMKSLSLIHCLAIDPQNAYYTGTIRMRSKLFTVNFTLLPMPTLISQCYPLSLSLPRWVPSLMKIVNPLNSFSFDHLCCHRSGHYLPVSYLPFTCRLSALHLVNDILMSTSQVLAYCANVASLL